MTSVSGHKVFVMVFCSGRDTEHERSQIKGAHTLGYFVFLWEKWIMCVKISCAVSFFFLSQMFQAGGTGITVQVIEVLKKVAVILTQRGSFLFLILEETYLV